MKTPTLMAVSAILKIGEKKVKGPIQGKSAVKRGK